MKKFLSVLLSLTSVICVAFSFVGCGNESGNAFDGKEIAKIETGISFGEVFMYYDPVRSFDFLTGTVTDTVTMSDAQIQRLLFYYNDDHANFPGYESAEELEKHLRTYYNSTEQVAVFSKEKGEAFINEVVSLGIYKWNEKYDNHSYTCGNYYNFTIIFTDGTQKETVFYDERPSNYKAIENAFEEYFGTGIYCTK